MKEAAENAPMVKSGVDLPRPGSSVVAYPFKAQNIAIRFGAFVMLPAERRLLKSGKEVRLGGRTFDILAALVERAPGLVSKQALLERVWPGLNVEEGNLRFQMTSLRKALGDQQNVARYVSTVQGRGYCFVANVSRGLHATEHFPPGREPGLDDAPRTNLKLPMHSIIGRESELAELADCLQRHRLVALVGSGGVGKTRLAVELGHSVLPRYPDGVWLVDLAPLSDAALLTRATTSALDLSNDDEEPTAENIAKRIASKELLLIFDNCEHLVEPVADFAERLLARAGKLTVLATSQESLRVAGEQVFRLEPLSVAPIGAMDVGNYGAVALFVELAGRADRQFALNAGNAECVADICRRLDGVPLALEMAVARLPLLGIERLRSGLEERLSMLSAGPRRSDLRHRTLRQMVEWSYDLLDEVDRAVFCRLAVFPGSFSLDAAIAVMAPFGFDRWATLDALWSLREKSLVATQHGAAQRYRLLEMLRFYAAEKLAGRGETDIAAGAHADYFTRLMSRAYAAWGASLKDDWEQICHPELDNVQVALEWALGAASRAPIALELISVSCILIYRHGSRDLDRYVAAAMILLDDETPPVIATRLWRLSCARQEDNGQISLKDHAKRAVALAHAVGDKLELGLSLAIWAYAEIRQGAYREAMLACEQLMKIAEETCSSRLLHRALNTVGRLAHSKGDLPEARRIFRAALEISQAAQDGFSEQNSLVILAETEFLSGNHQQAIGLVIQALAAEDKGRRPYLGAKWARINLASYLCLQGEISEARKVAAEALSEISGSGIIALCVCLQHWALLAALGGQFKAAATLKGFIATRYEEAGESFESTELQLDSRLQEILEANLSQTEILKCIEEGAKWSEAKALEFTLRHLVPSSGDQGEI